MITDIEKNLNRARQHLERDEKEQAHDLLTHTLKEHPTNIATLLMLGGYYFAENKLHEAEMVFEQLILQEPGTGQFSIALFNTLWKLDRIDEAIEEIRRFMNVADKTSEIATIDQYIKITRQLAQQQNPT